MLGEVLDATVYQPVDPGQREGVLAKMRDLRQHLASVGEEGKPTPAPVSPEDALAALKAHNAAYPITLSASLRGKLYPNAKPSSDSVERAA